MKKFVLILATALVASSLFMSCAKKKECYVCGEKKTGKEVTGAGETHWVCNDCYKQNKDAFEAIENYGSSSSSMYDVDEKKCDNCGKNKAVSKLTAYGQTIWVCGDCYEECKDFLDSWDAAEKSRSQ